MDIETAVLWLQDLDERSPLLHVAVRVFASLVIAVLLDWSLMRGARRLARRTATALDDAIVAYLDRPLLVTLFLGGAWLSTSGVSYVASIRLPIFRIAATALAFYWAISWVRLSRAALAAIGQSNARSAASGREGIRFVSKDTLPLFENLATVLSLGATFYLVLLVWDLDVTGWLASAGIAGIALGFAAQDSLANLFAGVFIFADRPYRIGDMIHLESGERGRVTHIGLRSTRILTRDHIQITLPNAIMASAKITNESGGPSPKFRIRAPVGAAYGSDVEKVRHSLLIAAAHCDNILRDPPPVVRLRALGESSLDFELLAWLEDPDKRGIAIDELLSRAYDQMRADGIEIPYPKRDLYIKEMPKN